MSEKQQFINNYMINGVKEFFESGTSLDDYIFHRYKKEKDC